MTPDTRRLTIETARRLDALGGETLRFIQAATGGHYPPPSSTTNVAVTPATLLP